MINRDREAFERQWDGRRLMMGCGPWSRARGRALLAFNAERVREGASLGGRAAAESLSPDQRTERARIAARASHSPQAHARAIARAWDGLDQEEQAAVREALGDVLREWERAAVSRALHRAWEETERSG